MNESNASHDSIRNYHKKFHLDAWPKILVGRETCCPLQWPKFNPRAHTAQHMCFMVGMRPHIHTKMNECKV